MVWNVSPASKLLGLPPEIREKVYGFALGTRLLKLKAGECVRRKHLAFAEGLGEPSGFYFPVLVDSPLPFLSRQIRTEGLPLAFRRVSLTADDMDGLIRLLIAIGDIGRSNVVSISCLWESCSEKAEIWARDPWAYPTSQLPRLHVLTAGFLLRQCRRLKHLCLYMYRDALNELSLESFKIDSGIRELCSMRNIERVDILDHEQQPIEENELVEWLKGEIQGNT
jgi:hypothetical protein